MIKYVYCCLTFKHLTKFKNFITICYTYLCRASMPVHVLMVCGLYALHHAVVYVKFTIFFVDKIKNIIVYR
jgi:hypothetical protein